jgi:choline dehydrogenase-like flavoprotein
MKIVQHYHPCYVDTSIKFYRVLNKQGYNTYYERNKIPLNSLRYDVTVVGSGPGGATVARELARAGKRALLLERGQDHRPRSYYGTYLGALLYTDRGSLLFTEEGLNIVRPMMVGGATSMYCGCAAPPPTWFKTKYGVDMDTEVSETIEELEIEPLPAELRGEASTHIAQAARALGYDWEPQLKFMKPARAEKFDCGAKCMLGCRCHAKWSAAEYVDQAVAAGCDLRTGARVERLTIEDGHIVGVEGQLNGEPFTARADTVVLSAGGIGTPRILQSSDFSAFQQAGQGMTMDITVMVYGTIAGLGTGKEPPMTWSWENLEEGYMLSTLIDPWLLYPLINSLKGLKYTLTWPRWKNTLGVMIKLKDDISGGVFSNGKISKPMTDHDRPRMRAAEEVCRRILIEAGAKPETIFTTPLRGTHPSGTVRLGTLVDENLQTEIQGLYVCDASVFPEALARPTVLTIIGLGKRLAKHILQS